MVSVCHWRQPYLSVALLALSPIPSCNRVTTAVEPRVHVWVVNRPMSLEGSASLHATPLTPTGGMGLGSPGFVYVLMRADSMSPLTGEALVHLPERLSGEPPRYPGDLQMGGVEGDVMVEGIIDTLGRIERGSLRVVSSTHRGFEDSALRTVASSVFRVARSPWRAVRVWVRVPISYRINR